MGKIELDHTGSGGGITLSSDGTSLLLGGTAIGGGGAYTIDAKTSAYTVVAGDLGKIINCTSGTFTISLTSAATLGAGWYCWIYNTDDGGSNFAVTIDPDGSETIGFKSTIVLRQLEGVKIVSDGTNWLVGDDRKSLFFQQNYRAGLFTPSSATGLLSTAIGRGATSSADDSFAAGSGSAGSGAKAAGSGSIALGNAYASGTDSFAAAITNNTSTYGATGANSIAMGKQAKTTAANAVCVGTTSSATQIYASVLGGYFNTASGTFSVVAGGAFNSAIGTYSFVTGNVNAARGPYSSIIGGSSNDIQTTASYAIASGQYANATIIGQKVHASGRFSGDGDAQGSTFILRADTTDATATVLTANNSTAGTTNQIVAASDTCITFDGTITAMQNGAQAYASWKIEGLLVNDGGTTTLANSATTVIQNLSSWGMALSADNTNNALAITVTGEAAHNIRWVANIRTTEVTYA